MKTLEELQKIISFGYLYLILMGLLQESIFFNQIGINILNYSSIADILISPIAILTSHPILLLALVVISAILFTIRSYLSKRSHKNWIQKKFLKHKPDLNEIEKRTFFSSLLTVLFLAALLCFFLGIGLGMGEKVAKKIANNKLEYTTKMTFSDGGSENVYLIETNSMYYFYLTKGSQNVKIAPIGNIKNLELTKN
jgi:magnesium-transporting ATPase (P-type)